MSASSIVIGFDSSRGEGRAHTMSQTRAGRIRADRPGGGAAAAVRLTRRGRLVVTMFLTVLIVAAFIVFGDASVATRDGGTAESVRIIEVEQGQTLWQIASSVAEPGETGEMVYRIRELNSLPGSGLVEGQELAVPLG